MLIGDIIATTSGCGDNKCINASVFWLAVDYYNRAKSADPTVANDANTKIATYSRYYPNKEDCFFYSITDGQTIEVPCYGESTKARFN